MSMDTDALRGAKVVFVDRRADEADDHHGFLMLARKFLDNGEVYTVQRTRDCGRYTKVRLLEISEIDFDTRHFDDHTP